MGKFFDRFKSIAPPVAVVDAVSPIIKTKKELLTVISNTGNGKDASLERQRSALQLVRYLETNAAVPSNLLEDAKAAKSLDGVWYLQYTAPSDINMDDMVR